VATPKLNIYLGESILHPDATCNQAVINRHQPDSNNGNGCPGGNRGH
jgi:hypothetical protein